MKMAKTMGNKLNPRIMGIVGSMGSGKTLFLSALAYKHQHSHTIFANYDLKTRHEDLTPQLVGDMMIKANEREGKKLVCIDEMHLFSDSRNSMSKTNQLMSYFMTQLRKSDIQLFYSTQQFGQVDVRVRDNTDVLAFPVYYEEVDILRVYFMRRHFLSGQFEPAFTSDYKGMKQIFSSYSTEQLMGRDVINMLKNKEKKEKDLI